MSNKVTLSVDGVWEHNLLNTVQVRDLPSFFVDEPERLGGSNKGPNPLEYFLGALSSCTSIMTAFVAKELGITYESLALDTSGELDPRGFQGVEGVQTYFDVVTIKITIRTDADEAVIQKLQDAVEKRCPLFNLLVDAGVQVKSEWMIQ